MKTYSLIKWCTDNYYYSTLCARARAYERDREKHYNYWIQEKSPSSGTMEKCSLFLWKNQYPGGLVWLHYWMEGSHYLLMQLKISNRRGLFLLSKFFPPLFSVNSNWKIQCPDELTIFKFKIQKAAVQEIGHLIQQLLGVHQSNHLPWCKLTHMTYYTEFLKISD